MRMTEESICAFLAQQERQGADPAALRRFKGFLRSLYRWLPEDKLLSRETLAGWRASLTEAGYTPNTVAHYTRGINLYLTYMGWQELRFRRGRGKDLRGMTFGWLTALEPTEKRYRRDILWRCRCACGRETEVPTVSLLRGNTQSCGCRKVQSAHAAGKQFAGTQLVAALRNRELSLGTKSGYTGVSPKGNRWRAYITYRGRRYNLGIYDDLSDAVKARARAKEQVMDDAAKLLELYETIRGEKAEV